MRKKWLRLKTWQKSVLIAALLAGTLFASTLAIGLFAFIAIPRLNITRRFERARAGDPTSQRILGFWYLEGMTLSGGLWSIPQDNKKALYWSGRAAHSGNDEAYFDYAQALENEGQIQQAKIWYTKAAHTGNLEAARKLKRWASR